MSAHKETFGKSAQGFTTSGSTLAPQTFTGESEEVNRSARQKFPVREQIPTAK